MDAYKEYVLEVCIIIGALPLVLNKFIGAIGIGTTLLIVIANLIYYKTIKKEKIDRIKTRLNIVTWLVICDIYIAVSVLLKVN